MTDYIEGKKYHLKPTGRKWSSPYGVGGHAFFRGDHFERAPETGHGYMTEYPFGLGYEYEVTPVDDEPTPKELTYLYPDGTEFSVFPDADGEITFSQAAFDSLVASLGAKPAPEKYEDGLYVDKDGDEVLWHAGRLWTGDETNPPEYIQAYGPLTPKEDQ